MSKENPERIFLGPICEDEAREGRSWCSERNDCPDCDEKAVEYIRSDLVAERLYQAGTEVANAKIEAQRLRNEIDRLKASGPLK